MRFTSVLLAAALVSNVLAVASANTIIVPVADSGFESPGASQFASWAHVNSTFWTPASDNPFGQNSGDNITAQSGAWSMFVTNDGSITQALATTVQAGDTLSISFFGGRANSGSTVNGVGTDTAEFIVGSTVYSQAFSTLSSQPLNSWVPFTFTTTITNGGALSLAFVATSGNVWLDSISDLTLTAVPEPASIGLLGLAVAGLGLAAAHQRRRQSKANQSRFA